MLPSMRYETKKLAELYHKRKSFQDHRQSVYHIKKKDLKSPLQRSRQLNQLRDRMHSAFNYTQMVRTRDIRKDNLKLYQKCFCGKNGKKSIIESNPESYENSPNKSLDHKSLSKSQEKINRNMSESGWKQLLLKNHRSSPIGKMTGYDRTRENLRLAVKITRPCPAINTQKLQKIHEQARKHKQRIMRYESSDLKSSSYLNKRLSSNTMRDSKNSSFNMSSRSPLSYEQNNKKVSIFRERKPHPQQYTFSLTEYKA